MEKLTSVQKLLDAIQSEEGETFVCDKDAVLESYENPKTEASSLPIKILSIFGGLLAALALSAFMGITGIFDAEFGLIGIGIFAILFAWMLNKSSDKLILDTFSISIYSIGVVSLAVGSLQMDVDENIVVLIVMAIAFASLYAMQNYVLSFMSTVTIAGCFLTLIIANDLYDLLHLYIAFYVAFMCYWFMNEAWIISGKTKLSQRYDSIRIGLIISFLFGLVTLGIRDLVPLHWNYIWISSITIAVSIFYLAHHIMGSININRPKHKNLVYGFSLLFLLPTLFCPSISGAILIILLGFMVNYKTGFAIGTLSLVYFVSQYYYDLNFTLLTKSIILFVSGLVLLIFYKFISKKTSEA